MQALHKTGVTLEMIKWEHSIFALPFAQNVPDDQLLRRGMDPIEGFYSSILQSEESLP
jgi:hypothetical protein